MSIKTRRIEEKIRALDVDVSCKKFLQEVFDWEVQAPSVRGHYTKPFEEFLSGAVAKKGGVE